MLSDNLKRMREQDGAETPEELLESIYETVFVHSFDEDADPNDVLTTIEVLYSKAKIEGESKF